jgi:hypothetical protein
VNAARGKALGGGALILCAIAGLAFLDPETSALFPPCLWRAATGWLCPGCGSARALHALLHGEIGVALAMNPLVVLALPLVAVDLRTRLGGRACETAVHARPGFVYALAVGIMAFGWLRNIAS